MVCNTLLFIQIFCKATRFWPLPIQKNEKQHKYPITYTSGGGTLANRISVEWPKQLVGTLAAAPTPPITIILDRSHYISLISPALLFGSKPVPYVSDPFVCLSQGTGRNGSLWSYLVVWGRVRHKRPQTQPSSSVITLLVFLTQLFKPGKTLMLIIQCTMCTLTSTMSLYLFWPRY